MSRVYALELVSATGSVARPSQTAGSLGAARPADVVDEVVDVVLVEAHVMLVDAHVSSCGRPHPHGDPEFHYLIAGTLRNLGQKMSDGDAYAAARRGLDTRVLRFHE